MKVGITGSHSTGKTTLLNALRSEALFQNYTIADEVTRKLAKRGLKINEDGDDNTQRAIMDSHIVNIFMNDNMLTDRTAIDGYVYTLWLFNHNKIHHLDTLNYARDVMVKTLPYYNQIFFIAPEFDITADGVRSTDVQFRDDIHELFQKVIKTFEIPVIPITGSVRNRVEQVIQHVEDYIHD